MRVLSGLELLQFNIVRSKWYVSHLPYVRPNPLNKIPVRQLIKVGMGGHRTVENTKIPVPIW